MKDYSLQKEIAETVDNLKITNDVYKDKILNKCSEILNNNKNNINNEFYNKHSSISKCNNYINGKEDYNNKLDVKVYSNKDTLNNDSSSIGNTSFIYKKKTFPSKSSFNFLTNLKATSPQSDLEEVGISTMKNKSSFEQDNYGVDYDNNRKGSKNSNDNKNAFSKMTLNRQQLILIDESTSNKGRYSFYNDNLMNEDNSDGDDLNNKYDSTKIVGSFRRSDFFKLVEEVNSPEYRLRQSYIKKPTFSDSSLSSRSNSSGLIQDNNFAYSSTHNNDFLNKNKFNYHLFDNDNTEFNQLDCNETECNNRNMSIINTILEEDSQFEMTYKNTSAAVEVNTDEEKQIEDLNYTGYKGNKYKSNNFNSNNNNSSIDDSQDESYLKPNFNLVDNYENKDNSICRTNTENNSLKYDICPLNLKSSALTLKGNKVIQSSSNIQSYDNNNNETQGLCIKISPPIFTPDVLNEEPPFSIFSDTNLFGIRKRFSSMNTEFETNKNINCSPYKSSSNKDSSTTNSVNNDYLNNCNIKNSNFIYNENDRKESYSKFSNKSTTKIDSFNNSNYYSSSSSFKVYSSFSEKESEKISKKDENENQSLVKSNNLFSSLLLDKTFNLETSNKNNSKSKDRNHKVKSISSLFIDLNYNKEMPHMNISKSANHSNLLNREISFKQQQDNSNDNNIKRIEFVNEKTIKYSDTHSKFSNKINKLTSMVNSKINHNKTKPSVSSNKSANDSKKVKIMNYDNNKNNDVVPKASQCFSFNLTDLQSKQDNIINIQNIQNILNKNTSKDKSTDNVSCSCAIF